MPKSTLTDVDVDKLFEEKGVDEIIEIEKSLDGEIEKKRSELRSMVGDRYKDILAASDAIKSMKTISEDIVGTIDKITNTCKILMTNQSVPEADTKHDANLIKRKNEERTLIIQLRLAISLNEQIWIALEEEDNLRAAHHCLYAQHIYMGLDLTNRKYLERILLLEHLKLNLSSLKAKIFQNISEKLEYVEITSQEASKNLKALMLLQNQTGVKMLEKLIEHRKNALNVVINSQHLNIRILVTAMVKCLRTSIVLYHDCFIKVEDLETDDFCDIQMPITPLLSYVPDVVKQYRPRFSVLNVDKSNAKVLVNDWLLYTKKSLEEGLKKSFQSVTTVKALQLIREEYKKIKVPDDWKQICADLHFPDDFNLWHYFFQDLLTFKAKSLISDIISHNKETFKNNILALLDKISKQNNFELDLRGYGWSEDHSDVSKTDFTHAGLAMKARGFSRTLIDLCEKFDRKYLELLEDVWPYLYGLEFKVRLNEPLFTESAKDTRFVDREELKNHLKDECIKYSVGLPKFIEDQINSNKDKSTIAKSVFFARFLQAACQMCANFKQSCEFDGNTAGWRQVCTDFSKTGNGLWANWVDSCAESTGRTTKPLSDTNPSRMIQELYKWDEIEIQEQTEEKTFKSHIRVPLKPSVALVDVLNELNEHLAKILPYTLPNVVHNRFLESNARVVLEEYKKITSQPLNQIMALQFLFDVRFFMTLCVPREAVDLVNSGQNVCDELRNKIDPFDLDVFYSYLQNNVKKAVGQLQTLYGCLLPLNGQLASSELSVRHKAQEKMPSLLALSTPSSNVWFPLLPITGPFHKPVNLPADDENLEIKEEPKTSGKTLHESLSSRQLASSLFGGLASEWFT